MSEERDRLIHEVDVARRAVATCERSHAATLEEIRDLAGLSGLWAKLTGGYDAEIKRLEQRALSLIEERRAAVAALAAKEAELDAFHSAASVAEVPEPLDPEMTGMMGELRVELERELGAVKEFERLLRRLSRMAEEALSSTGAISYSWRASWDQLCGEVQHKAASMQVDVRFPAIPASSRSLRGGRRGHQYRVDPAVERVREAFMEVEGLIGMTRENRRELERRIQETQ